MKKSIITLTLLLSSFTILSQEKDTISVFHLIQRSWVANQTPSYFSIVSPTYPVEERRIGLIEGEGRKKIFSLAEVNLNLRFPLFLGRKDKGTRTMKLNRVTLDYATNFRMTFDESKPLTTPNQKIGISWELNLWNNITKWIRVSGKRKMNYLYTRQDDFNFYNFKTSLHHYSNGQSGISRIYNDPLNMSGGMRNNYKNGDFSTNYFKFELTKGKYAKENLSLTQYSLAYRVDWEAWDVLSFSDDYKDAYGRHRFEFNTDYRSRRLHLRSEIGYITSNLDRFVSNIKNDNKKYRFSGKMLFEYTPVNHRSVGYFISAYYGRDYLNIRYDDIIYSIQWGITVTLDKYYNPVDDFIKYE